MGLKPYIGGGGVKMGGGLKVGFYGILQLNQQLKLQICKIKCYKIRLHQHKPKINTVNTKALARMLTPNLLTFLLLLSETVLLQKWSNIER